ncbi:MAG: twin-arginine translocation signal domain-containing protein [Faecalibacterium sp.]|nr:twin-arginine translocation signal domain-containing protein [Faecalibacterium sp.]
MKEMNRREFLTLTGAAVVALSLAGCVGAPSAPTPSNDIRVQQALDALNQFRRDKGLTELVYEKDLEELTDLLISPFVKEGKPVVDTTMFENDVKVKEAEIKQALFNKGYPIYATYFTAGLGSKGPNKLETLKYPTNEAQGQKWLTYMSEGINMAVDNPHCFAMSVRSIGDEDYYIALVVGEKVSH